MAKTRAIRIKIGDATFTTTEVQTRVEKPSLVPDADPADLIAETAGEAEREAMFARLDAAHSRFIDAMGADGRKVRRMTIRGYGTPKGGDSQGFQYIPPDWLNLKNALCDKWTMNLAKEDGSPWRLSVVFLTPAGLVTSITGGAYEGLGFRPFHVDETLRIVETEARGGPVDRKDKGLKGTSCYALLVSVAMEQGFAVVPEARAVEPKANPYTFQRGSDKGDFWHIVFEGQALPQVRHLAGLTYLRAILASPGRQVSALALYRLENPPPPEEVTPNKGEALDPAARKWYGTGGTAQRVMEGLSPEKLRACKAALEATLENEDLSDKQRDCIDEKIKMFDKELNTAHVARATGGATFEPKIAKGPRQSVAASINYALDVIADKPNGGNLAKHLHGAVIKGKTLSYVGGLTWQT